MKKLHGIYVTKLRKGMADFGVKIGVSSVPEQRARAKNQKSFDYAEPYGIPEIGYTGKPAAKRIEDELKITFRRFLVETDNKTQEIFFPEVFESLVWAVRQSLASPRNRHAIAWRAANTSLTLLGKPQVELFRSTMTKWDHSPTPFVTHHINWILEQRFMPYKFYSPVLDAGYAKNIILTDTPRRLRITYVLNFSIDPGSSLETPCWSPFYLEGMCFCPSENIDIEKARSKQIRSPGFNSFSVKFTETLTKKTGQQEAKVSSVSGRRLDQDIEEEFLQAKFFDY